jgi:hypothetical protein
MIAQLFVVLSILAVPFFTLYLIHSMIKRSASKKKVFVSTAILVLSALCVVLYHLPKQVFPEGRTFSFIEVKLGENDITLNNADEVGELLSNVRGHRVLGSFATDGCEGQGVRIWMSEDQNGNSWMLYAPEDGVRFLQKTYPKICIRLSDDDTFYTELLELIQQNIS